MRCFPRCLLLLALLLVSACNRGAPPALPGGPSAAPLPVPYLETILSPSESAGIAEKYRALFSSEPLLEAVTFNRMDSFPQWSPDRQAQFLKMILHYESTGGNSMPLFNGACAAGGLSGCWRMTRRAIGGNPVAEMSAGAEYREYLKLAFVAWNFYVEANALVPWSILNYSRENLDLLFYNRIGQPVLGSQFFGADLDITENYRLVRGLLREEGDSRDDLVGMSAKETLANILRFAGRRVVHFRGGATNTMGPDSRHWPYRDRSNPAVAMARYPTPAELLLGKDPHNDLLRDAEAPFKPKYHIVNGCWGGSQLLRSLLHAVNLPVELVGNYFHFSGHSGARFHEIEKGSWLLQHADNLYYYPWALALLDRGDLPLLHEGGELPEGEGADPFETDLHLLALRSLEFLSPVSLFMHCESPALERNYLPVASLTAEETALLLRKLDEGLEARRRSAGEGRTCLELFGEEVETLYRKKTGLEMNADEDGDGFPNIRDCRAFKPDPAPCPLSEIPKALF